MQFNPGDLGRQKGNVDPIITVAASLALPGHVTAAMPT
jgi:hypothetical protein